MSRKGEEFRFKGFESITMQSDGIPAVEGDYDGGGLYYKELSTGRLFSGCAMYDSVNKEWTVYGTEIIVC